MIIIILIFARNNELKSKPDFFHARTFGYVVDHNGYLCLHNLYDTHIVTKLIVFSQVGSKNGNKDTYFLIRNIYTICVL